MNTKTLCIMLIVCCCCILLPGVVSGALWYRTRHTVLLSADKPVTFMSENSFKTKLPAFGKEPMAYTLSFWIKIPTTSSKWRNVFRFGSTDFVRTPGVYIVPNSTILYYRHGSVADDKATAFTTGNDWGPAGIPLNQSTWNHVVVTLQDRTFIFYVNGKKALTALSPATPAVANSTTNEVIFGTASAVDPTAPLTLCDVRFYPVALSPYELYTIFKPNSLT